MINETQFYSPADLFMTTNSEHPLCILLHPQFIINTLVRL